MCAGISSSPAAAKRAWQRAWPWLAAVLVGLAAGVGSAVWVTGTVFGERVASSPEWSTDPLAGSRRAGLYTRARIARAGLLALNGREALYYLADRDASGRRLRQDCAYRMSGGDLPGRWWSLTVYAADGFLAPNQDHADSIMGSTLLAAATADGAWQARLGPARAGDGPWLSTRATGAPSMLLRVYQPSAALRAQPLHVVLPRIQRLSCRTGGGA
jgi:hypothetical protein